MRPLYIDGVPGCRVVLDEPALRIVVPDKADQLFPLSRISRIVCKGVVEWSMSAMLACTDAGINLIFLYKNGDVRARWLSVGTTRQSLSQRLIDLLARADGLERYENWYLSMYKLAVRSCARKLNFDNWREIPIKEMEQFVMSNLSVAGKYQVKLMLGIVHSELLVLLTDSDFGCDDEAILSEQLDLAADMSKLLLWDFYPSLLKADKANVDKPFADMALLYQQREDHVYLLFKSTVSKLQQFLLSVS